MIIYILLGIVLIGYTGYVLGRNENKNVEQRMAKAKDLRDRNVITEEEYQSVRRNIIILQVLNFHFIIISITTVNQFFNIKIIYILL